MVRSPVNPIPKQQPLDSSSCKYKGVRKRKWGKYVCEIRLPNSRERIWLGSYDTAEKAARAFDAAMYCLRGRNAKFNFPDNPPEIANGRSMTPAEIQAAAARFAHSEPSATRAASAEATGRVEELDSQSDYCPSESVSLQGSEITEMPLANNFLDPIFSMGADNDMVSDYGVFSGLDDFPGNFFVPTLPEPESDFWSDNNDSIFFSPEASSFLWNFEL